MGWRAAGRYERSGGENILEQAGRRRQKNMTEKLYEKIAKYCREEQLVEAGDRLVLGVSGGADSVFLFHFFLWLRMRVDISFVVVHVDHGIRGEEAKKDRDFVKRLAEEEAIRFIQYETSIPELAKKWKMTEEEAGRVYRYRCFEETLEHLKGTKLAVAHHRDDQAETVLFQLFRGSALRGLGGMSPKNGHVIRPLLCVSRSEIEETLQREGIEYCIDSTNDENVYARNKLRNQLFPWVEKEIRQGAGKHIAKSADYIRDLVAYIDAETEKLYQAVAEEGPECRMVREKAFLELFPALQRELILKMLVSLSGRKKDIETEHIEQVRRLFLGGTGKKLSLPYGLQARKDYDRLIIERKKEPVSKLFEAQPFHAGQSYEIPFTTGETLCFMAEKKKMESFEKNSLKKYCTKCFDYDKIESVALFRYYAQGDYLWTRPQGGKKKLSRLFIDEKIPQERRRRIVVLAEGSHVLWIPELDRVSAFYYLTEQTKQMIYIKKKGE